MEKNGVPQAKLTVVITISGGSPFFSLLTKLSDLKYNWDKSLHPHKFLDGILQ